MADKEKTKELIWSFLTGKGLSEASTAGVMGNIYAESGYDPGNEVLPTAKNNYEHAGGLIMWSDNAGSKNFTALKNDANKQKVSWKYLDFQLNYLWSYISSGTWVSTYKKNDSAYAAYFPQPVSTANITTYSQWKVLTDPVAACDVFCFRGERPSKKYSHADRRREEAKAVYTKYSGKQYEYDKNPDHASGEYQGSTTDNEPTTQTIPSNIPAFISLTSINPYDKLIQQNVKELKADGYNYGYLIDLTHGGEFKFYVPEFTETAGANWGDIDIPGRSVSIKSYNNTTSRSIVVNLDLYAGVGIYKSGDVVSKLHKDANFVKSLEYPDYNNYYTSPPSTVQLLLGSTINLVGVVSSVSVEHLKPLDTQNRAMYLKVSFTVTQNTSNPPGYKDIRNGNYTIISSTMNTKKTASKKTASKK